MNLADSSTLVANMITRGYRRVADEIEADLIIFNTCSVREKAEERVYGRLGEVYKFKRKKPHLKIAVVGCMAQRLGEKLKENVPYVDYVLGTDRLFELPDVIEDYEGTSPVMTAFGYENMDSIKPFKETPYAGFVTISRGCDNFCTYCIVPYVRGRERAHSPDYIVNAVNKMVGEGVVEITLLGQNVNSYRSGDVNFPDLLERIVRETDLPRLRFMTSHPKDLSTRLVDVMAGEANIMPHIHLPLQAGSDRVLEKMGRGYTFDHYYKIIEYIRENLDYVSVTTDLMVGFPTETDGEFEQTLDAVKKVRYDAAFMFRYSVRPGTKAAAYPDDVPDEIKIDRLKRLINLQQEIGHKRNQRELNRICYSVVEGRSRRNRDIRRARTEDNKTILFKANNVDVGSIVPLRVIEADAFTLHGEPVEVV